MKKITAPILALAVVFTPLTLSGGPRAVPEGGSYGINNHSKHGPEGMRMAETCDDIPGCTLVSVSVTRTQSPDGTFVTTLTCKYKC